MKFTIADSSLLWQAINRVTKATPRNTMGSEREAMCIETTAEGELWVHRYSAEAYAEHRVEATVTEAGKIIVGDATVARSLQNRVSFEPAGTDLVGVEVANPTNRTLFRLSGTDPFLYTRIESEVKVQKLSINLGREILWVSKDSKFLYDWVLMDGTDIITSNQISIVLMQNGELITEQPVFVPASFFLAYGKDSQIGFNYEFGNHKVWVVEKDFRYYNTIMEKPYRKGDYRRIVMNALAENNAKVVVDKQELGRILQATFVVSEDNIYRDGYCHLSRQGGELVIQSMGSDKGGEITRTLEAREISGQFSVKNYPRLILNALATIEDEADNVTLDIWHSEEKDGYAIVLHSDKVYNFIPCSRG